DVEAGFETGARAGPALPPLRPADLSHFPGAGEVRLELSRPDHVRDAPARHRADHRPAAFRPAGLAEGFPEPRMARALRRVRARLRGTVSMGALLHAGERDLRDRAFLLRLRLVERAA